jgi:hypothetical protein
MKNGLWTRVSFTPSLVYIWRASKSKIYTISRALVEDYSGRYMTNLYQFIVYEKQEKNEYKKELDFHPDF